MMIKSLLTNVTEQSSTKKGDVEFWRLLMLETIHFASTACFRHGKKCLLCFQAVDSTIEKCKMLEPKSISCQCISNEVLLPAAFTYLRCPGKIGWGLSEAELRMAE